MPQKVIKFTGINRKVNEFQGSGACEELINLRPTISGGHHVVKPKRIEIESVDYDGIYEHAYGSIYNRLAIIDGVVKWINPKQGESVTITDKFSGKAVSISHAGNVLVVYCEETKEQEVYKFESETYTLYNVSILPITSVEVGYTYDTSLPASNTAIADDSSVEACNAALHKAASGFYGKYPNGLCGAAVIGCAYELNDGSELWSTGFITANITREIGYVAPTLDENLQLRVTGATKVGITLSFGDAAASEIKKVNIYATRPVFQFEVKNNDSTSHALHRIVQVPLEDVDLDGQLMYYQGSITPGSNHNTLLLDFGQDQAGDNVMNVNSGCIERTGMSASYNNRFHYYRSESNHVIQVPTVSFVFGPRDQVDYWVPFVKIDGKWFRINKSYKISSTRPNDFIYPMAGIKQMLFVKSSTTFITPYDEAFFVNLTDSSSYNYSYAFDVTPDVVELGDEIFSEIKSSGQYESGVYFSRVKWKDEVNVINVSAPFNPFVFPVEYSYSFGGEIIDITTSYLPISATQVGQYPISVFTTNGIYALEQGDGSVLYSNVTPLQPLVINGKATSTPFGTFFTSSKSLYLLSGRDSANISYVLNGERELTLRDTEAYRKLVCNKTGVIYDFSPFISSEDFESFIDNVALVYDQLNNEIYVSKADGSVPYSYVLNLDTKAYHKVSKRYLSTQNGSRYAIEVEGSTRNVVDLHTEESSEQHILLQSRPMPLEMAFTHIQRLLLLIDAKLTGKAQNLCFTVFASDNLYDWNCIITSQKRSTILRQICTNRAAKSYRDYVILITGTVDTDTDISDIIADYTIVNRRLG